MQGLLNEREMMAALGVCRSTMTRMRKRGMPYVRIGRRTVRYRLDDVLVWLRDGQTQKMKGE